MWTPFTSSPRQPVTLRQEIRSTRVGSRQQESFGGSIEDYQTNRLREFHSISTVRIYLLDLAQLVTAMMKHNPMLNVLPTTDRITPCSFFVARTICFILLFRSFVELQQALCFPRLHHLYNNATAPTSAKPATPKSALFTPAPLDPVAPAPALVASASNLLAASLTAAVLELTRLLILVSKALVPLPVSVALLLLLLLLALVSKAVMVPVASLVANVMLWRVSDGDADEDVGALVTPDCVKVITVTEFAIVEVMVIVSIESCAMDIVASAKVPSVEARIVAAVLWVSIVSQNIVWRAEALVLVVGVALVNDSA